MPAIPTPGTDSGTWGTALNNFLEVELNSSTGAALMRSDGTVLNPATSVQTSNYTAVPGDLVQCDVSSGSFTVLAPQAPKNAVSFAVKLVNNATGLTNTLTVATQGTDVFNKPGGTTSMTLTIINEAAEFTYNATQAVWVRVGSDRGSIIDTTASDIQPMGNQAAGSSVLVADATHVHPATGWTPNDYSLAAWTYDPMIVSSSVAPTTNTIYMMGVKVRVSTSVSHIYFVMGGTPASGVTASENFCGLYSSTTLLASVATDSSFGGGTGALVTLNITSTALTPGLYWVAFLMNATTMPTLGNTWGTTNGTSMWNLNLSSTTYRQATGGTGTALPGSTPVLTSQGKNWWTAIG